MSRGPAEQQKEAVVRAYFQRVTQGDVEAILELFHDDAVLVHPLTEKGIRGKAALRAFYQNLTSNLVDYSAVPTDIVIEGDKVVAPLHLEGKTSEGQPIVMNNLNFYTFAGEKIQSLHIYMDTHPYRAALSGTLRNEQQAFMNRQTRPTYEGMPAETLNFAARTGDAPSRPHRRGCSGCSGCDAAWELPAVRDRPDKTPDAGDRTPGGFPSGEGCDRPGLFPRTPINSL